MSTSMLPRGASLIDDEVVEPMTAVFARLSGNVDELSLAGCEQWLVDAQRMTGWLAVTRLRVEQARWAHNLASWTTPEPDDGAPADHGPRTPDARAGAAHPCVGPGEGSGEPAPAPVDAPNRRSRRREARDRKLQQGIDLLPSFGVRLELGELTEDHVVAVDAIRNQTVARDREGEILAAALERTAEDFAAWLCSWDAFVDLERHGDLTARQKTARKLQLFDRTNDFRGTLAPADFDAFGRTLRDIDADLNRRRDPNERLSWDQRMADALVEMMHRARGASAGSVVLDMGRARRYADDTQWLALLARDGGCALCDAPLGTLDAHHHPHWQKGGTTDLCTMCLCCTRCHRRIHAERITITFTDGRIHAARPDGTPIPTRNRRDRGTLGATRR